MNYPHEDKRRTPSGVKPHKPIFNHEPQQYMNQVWDQLESNGFDTDQGDIVQKALVFLAAVTTPGTNLDQAPDWIRAVVCQFYDIDPTAEDLNGRLGIALGLLKEGE